MVAADCGLNAGAVPPGAASEVPAALAARASSSALALADGSSGAVRAAIETSCARSAQGLHEAHLELERHPVRTKLDSMRPTINHSPAAPRDVPCCPNPDWLLLLEVISSYSL